MDPQLILLSCVAFVIDVIKESDRELQIWQSSIFPTVFLCEKDYQWAIVTFLFVKYVYLFIHVISFYWNWSIGVFLS